MEYRISLEHDLSTQERQVIGRGIDEYNQARAGDDNHQPLALVLRDEAGQLVGGLLGDTYYGWCAISLLWLREDVRQHGFGSQLLAAAEQEAQRRGCHGAHLDTFSFQARGFYERHGYTVFGELGGFPGGHTRYYMQKMFSDE